MKKTLIVMAISAALAGCASFPADFDKPLTVQDIEKETASQWSATPAIQYITSESGFAVRRHWDIPDHLMDFKVSYAFEHDALLSDLMFALETQKIRVVPQGLTDIRVPLRLNHFDGTLTELLDTLEAVHDINYEFRKGVLFLVPSARYEVSLPQNQPLIDAVSATVTELGGEDVKKDLASGRIFYKAKPYAADAIEHYLEVIGKNSAMVTLQMAVLDVRLNRDFAIGMDWAEFSVQKGVGDLMTEAAPKALGRVATVTGSGMGYRLVQEGFNLAAAIRALSRFGNARTDQNVILGTLSGAPVRISSGNQIPYVKEVGATTAGGSNSVTGSATTEIVRSGLSLEVTPSFDAQDFTITTGVKVEMSSLVGFRELSAGQNLGTLSQPEIQEMSFENIGRLRPGETMIIGGITYDQLSNNYTNLPFLERLPIGSESRTVSRHALYIVLRPTVVVFGHDPATEEDEGDEPPLKGAGLDAQLTAIAQAGKVTPINMPPLTSLKISSTMNTADLPVVNVPTSASEIPKSAVGAPGSKASAAPKSASTTAPAAAPKATPPAPSTNSLTKPVSSTKSSQSKRTTTGTYSNKGAKNG